MKKVIIAALAFAPAVAFAQELGNLTSLLESIGGLVRTALPIVVAVALLVFFWGLVKFIFAGPEAKKEGQDLMIWGVVALFVMVSVWGLVNFVGSALNIEKDQLDTTPTVPGL